MMKKSLILALCFLLAFPVNVVLAAPSGGQVVQGQANISQSGAKTTINQSSDRAIVNWKNFDIAGNEAVLHNMPSRNSAALHRVVGGGGASQLAGELKSNGNIFLVNPAGVVIHKGARIDAGGFLATTHDIANEDFMRGNYAFTKPGQPGAAVINQGNITVRDQGFAALVAPTVRNEGVIAARLGKVALASGDAFKLDFYGDDLINFSVPESTVDRLHTPEGTPLGVDNSGTIKAEGGVVLLSATQLDGVVSSVVNNSGLVSASSAELKGGRIVFGGEGDTVDVKNTGTVTASSDKSDGGVVRMAAGGTVSVSGTVEARGANKGGTVDISGAKKTELIHAAVSTEGGEGGLIRVGGEFQGGKVTADDTMKAAFVDRFDAETLASTGELFADASSSLNAGLDGTLIAWSEGATELHGGLTGRYVETSGRTLTVSDAPNLTGNGIWLIDPTNVDIVNGGLQGINNSATGNTTIDAAWLGTYVNGQNIVSILADNLIRVLDNIAYENGQLSLSAGSRIDVKAAITSANGGLQLSAPSIISVENSIIDCALVSIGTYSFNMNNARILASDSMFLNADRLNIVQNIHDVNAAGSPISVADYLTLSTSVGNTITIGAGTEGSVGARALIKAGTAYFVEGGFALNPYSIEAEYVGWDSGVSLVGPTGGGDEPHIFGVKGLYPDGQSSTPASTDLWPFTTVNLNAAGVLAITEKRDDPTVLGNPNYYELKPKDYSTIGIPYIDYQTYIEHEMKALLDKLNALNSDLEKMGNMGANEFTGAIGPMVGTLQLAALLASYNNLYDDLLEKGIARTAAEEVILGMLEKFGGGLGEAIVAAVGGLPGAFATYLTGMADLMVTIVENGDKLVGNQTPRHMNAAEQVLQEVVSKTNPGFYFWGQDSYKNMTFNQLQAIISNAGQAVVDQVNADPGTALTPKNVTLEHGNYAAKKLFSNWLEANADALSGKDPAALQRLLQ